MGIVIVKLSVFASKVSLIPGINEALLCKPSVQLSKHLQDGIKHAVMKLELEHGNHKNVHCMRLHNARAICQLDNYVLISRHDLKLDIDESAKSHQALKPTQSKKVALF